MDKNSGFERFKAFYQTHPLWSGELLGLKQFSLSQFEFEENDHKQWQLPVIPQGTVLGKRAEYYFKYCIDQSSNYECLVSNLQVFKGNRTLGELDYIIEHKSSGERYHVELVYKFYLYRPDLENVKLKTDLLVELSKYIGPNERDNLLKKINHLKTHQFPMLYRKETRELLYDLQIKVNDLEQRVCFLAHLFIPCELWNEDYPFINKSCIAGYYLDYSAFAKAETCHLYFLPHKHAWKMEPYELTVSYSHQEILIEVKKLLNMKFAPMIWKLDREGNFERFFVIKDLVVI
jgi:hypothetical protein